MLAVDDFTNNSAFGFDYFNHGRAGTLRVEIEDGAAFQPPPERVKNVKCDCYMCQLRGNKEVWLAPKPIPKPEPPPKPKPARKKKRNFIDEYRDELERSRKRDAEIRKRDAELTLARKRYFEYETKSKRQKGRWLATLSDDGIHNFGYVLIKGGKVVLAKPRKPEE